MLREVDELAGELKCPVESTGRTIHVELHRQIEKVLHTFLIDSLALRVLCEEQTERKRVGHLRVVHLHVWSNFTFWFALRETIDHVIRLRAVGKDALPIEKIAPFHDDFRDAT